MKIYMMRARVGPGRPRAGPGPAEGGPDLEGQGQGRQNWLRAGPDRPVDSLTSKPLSLADISSRYLCPRLVVSTDFRGEAGPPCFVTALIMIGLAVPNAVRTNTLVLLCAERSRSAIDAGKP